VPGGRVELPTNPESFRGCSTAEDGKSRGLDFSFALEYAPVCARLRRKGLLFWRRSEVCCQGASLLPCVRANAVQTERQDQWLNRCSVGRWTLE